LPILITNTIPISDFSFIIQQQLMFFLLSSVQAYLLGGLGGGFLTFIISASMIPAWLFFCQMNKHFGHQTLK